MYYVIKFGDRAVVFMSDSLGDCYKFIGEYYNGDMRHLVIAHGLNVAQAVVYSMGANEEEVKANAAFIATAPETAAERDRLKAVNAELLEACRKALAWTDYMASTNRVQIQSWVVPMHNAVAKAEGRS